MTRTILLAAGLLAVSTSAFAQANPEVDKALLAAPANAREAATVIKWKDDGTYDTLKAGTNTLVCYDQSGQPTEQPFSVQCTSKGNLERVKQNKMFEKEADRDKRTAAIAAAEKDGSRVKPEFGSVWWNLSGAEQATARAAHDRRRARRDHRVDRPARQQQDGRRLDHGRRHVQRPHHGARPLGRTHHATSRARARAPRDRARSPSATRPSPPRRCR